MARFAAEEEMEVKIAADDEGDGKENVAVFEKVVLEGVH